jgi:hypothetical protein
MSAQNYSATPTIAVERAPGLDLVGSLTQPTVGSIVAAEYGTGPHRQTVITFTNAQVAWTDNGGSGGYTTVVGYTFPRGLVDISSASLIVTSATFGAGVGATATTAVASVGTAAEATGTTLDSTQANLVPSTSLGTLVASAITATRRGRTSSRPGIFDGTSTASTAIVNFAADATDSTASVTAANAGLIFSGTLVINWSLQSKLNGLAD